MKTMPVKQHGWQAGEQAIRNVLLILEIAFRLDVAEKRYARAQHIHRVGIGRHYLEYRPESIRQSPICLDPGDEGVEFCLRRQCAMKQQVCNLFEARIVRKIVNIVATIRQSGAFLTDRANVCLASSNAGESARLLISHHLFLRSSGPVPGTA